MVNLGENPYPEGLYEMSQDDIDDAEAEYDHVKLVPDVFQVVGDLAKEAVGWFLQNLRCEMRGFNRS